MCKCNCCCNQFKTGDHIEWDISSGTIGHGIVKSASCCDYNVCSDGMNKSVGKSKARKHAIK